jgi:SAM-dependent methyltransferase
VDLTEMTTPWQVRARQSASPIWKRSAYALARPILHARSHRLISGDLFPSIRWVITDRGLPLETRRRWAARVLPLAGGRIAVAGTGTGWDAVAWRDVSPSFIVGAELFDFRSSWSRIAGEHRGVVFVRSALEHLSVGSGKLDGYVSDMVLEHCRDLDSVLSEAHRALHDDGGLYAAYGPLWNCWGGDHFSGVDGLENGFAHLEMESDEYQDYVTRWRHLKPDAQDGARYIDLDLFSHLTSQGYAAAFDRAGFEIVESAMEVSTKSLEFRRRYPGRFQLIADRAGVGVDDLLVKGHVVLARKKDR